MFDNSNTLPANYHNRFVQEIKRYYMPLRIFSVWVFGLALMGLFGFIYSVLTDESYSSGLFEDPFIKATMLVIGLTFILGIVAATFALVLLPIRKIKKAINKSYSWKICPLSQDNSNSRLILLGMKQSDYNMIQYDDNFVIITLDNIRFALLA